MDSANIANCWLYRNAIRLFARPPRGWVIKRGWEQTMMAEKRKMVLWKLRKCLINFLHLIYISFFRQLMPSSSSHPSYIIAELTLFFFPNNVCLIRRQFCTANLILDFPPNKIVIYYTQDLCVCVCLYGCVCVCVVSTATSAASVPNAP